MMVLRDVLGRLRGGLDSQTRACGEKVTSYIRRRWNLMLLRRTVDDAFDNVDLVVLPTMRVTPGKLSDWVKYRESKTPTRLTRWSTGNCQPFNVLDLPAISIPCGFSSGGLPVG